MITSCDREPAIVFTVCVCGSVCHHGNMQSWRLLLSKAALTLSAAQRCNHAKYSCKMFDCFTFKINIKDELEGGCSQLIGAACILWCN